MKTIVSSLMTAAFVVSAITASAAEDAKKEVTLEGSATCGKCDLGKEKECTNVLQVKEGDKTVTYYLTGKADKEWHKNICKGAKDVKVTGTVSEKDGKKTLDATKIEMAAK